MRFANECRQQCNRQQHDQPRRVRQQTGAKRQNGNQILCLTEQLRHQTHAPHGLAARPFQLILQIGVLEILEIQGRRMLHQPDRGGVSEHLGQHRVHIARQPTEQIVRYRQCEFKPKEQQQVVQRPILQRQHQVIGDTNTDQANRLVNDQLADIQGDDRKQRAQQSDDHRRNGQRFAGRPDFGQKGPDIAHRAEAFAQIQLGLGQWRWHRNLGYHRPR